MSRYVCIHGHFYQPPRENPWLNVIERQPSAAPYRDWNVRITRECYARNAAARVLDRRGRVERLVNNYARISFNFGPTLLRWLETHEPRVYAAILEADRLSQRAHNGHGSAMAQAYHHVILPLANERDRKTEVIWGLRDFSSRFGRPAEGMWLPETAVDVPTLETLAEHGVSFTILAPHQAARVRPLGEATWRPVTEGGLDTRRAYLARLPSGRSINLFFYDGGVSRGVAFEGLLKDGARFADRLASAFRQEDNPQLVHIATDGESYGHHHRFGEMALAFATDKLSQSGDVRLTNYGEFLGRHPPLHEVQIAEPTSWSCAHGVERWRSDCGCRIGHDEEWTQAWRSGVRDALDWLRDRFAESFTQRGAAFFSDPWEARDAYIDVVRERGDGALTTFVGRHASHRLEHDELVEALRLLEIQRHMLMAYTSCGWFFDELSGVEPQQNLRCAARAIEIADTVLGDALTARIEREFRTRLAQARSNVEEVGSGNDLYDRVTARSSVRTMDVAVATAAADLMDRPEPAVLSLVHDVETHHREQRLLGEHQVSTWAMSVTSRATRARRSIDVVAIGGPSQRLQFWTRPTNAPIFADESWAELVRAAEASDASLGERLATALGQAGFLSAPMHRSQLIWLVDAAREAAMDGLKGEAAQEWLRFSALAGTDGLDETAHTLLGLMVQDKLRRALAAGCPANATTDHTALAVTVKAHELRLDRTTLAEAATRGALELLGRLDEGDADAARRLKRLKQMLEVFSIPADLWEVEQHCLELVGRAVDDARSGIDEVSMPWRAALTELADVLGLRVADAPDA